MSVMDELKGLEEKVRNRMRELRPLVQEYADLERVAQRLGVKADDVASPAAPAPAPSPAAAPRKASGKNGSGSKKQASRAVRTPSRSRTTTPRAATTAAGPRTGTRRPPTKSSERSAQILALVNDRPGITVREIGSELGVDPTSLYRVIRRLESSGQVSKAGKNLQPV